MSDEPNLTFRRGIHFVLTLQSPSEKKEICIFEDEKRALLEKLESAITNVAIQNDANDRIKVRREGDEVVVSEYTGDRWRVTRHSVADCDKILMKAIKEML